MWIRFFSDDELEGIGFQVQYSFTAGQSQNEVAQTVERFKFLGNTISFISQMESHRYSCCAESPATTVQDVKGWDALFPQS